MYSMLLVDRCETKHITFVLHVRSSSCILFKIFSISIDTIALRNICYAMAPIAVKQHMRALPE